MLPEVDGSQNVQLASTTLDRIATALEYHPGNMLTACLKKLQKMASDPIALKTSAVQKLAEFARLKYPSKLLWTACTTMGVNTRDPTWFRVREKIPSA